MFMMKLVLSVVGLLLSIHGALAQAPITILGLSSRDRVLASFWAQRNNASNTVVGLNVNASGIVRFSDALLPLVISNKTLSGTFTGTNTFKIQTYDAGAAHIETFSFDFVSGDPANSNVVSRVGSVEGLRYKTIYNARFTDGSGYLDGILRARGTNYLSAIPPKTGTNTYVFGSSSLTFVDGVLSSSTGVTNIVGTGLTSLNGLSAPDLRIGTNSTGSDFNITTSSLTNITINLPTASASARGLLSAADWSNFNSKATNTATIGALGSYNQNGLMTQVSENTFAGRMIVSGDGSIEVVNGDGVSGDIDIRLSGLMFYIPSDSAAPSGDPDEHIGKTAMIYDTTAHRIWVFDGTWRYIDTTP